MALPSSGALSLRDIADELGINPNTSLSLAGMSGTAGFSDPDSISEFYGYSAVAGAVNLGYHSSLAALSCGISSGSYTTYYHDGAGTLPVINDKLYTDASQTSYAPNGYYSNGTNSFRVFYNAGSIIAVTSC